MEKSARNGSIPAYMRRLAALIVLTSLLLLEAVFGANGEEDFYKSAVEAFKDRFYERAEEQFGAFATNFPGSTNAPLAVLYQAQARHLQKKHDAAIELVKNNLPKAGAVADQYIMTWADALSAKGEHTAAAGQYGRLLKDFPQSPLRIQAAYLQALSIFQQKDFAQTIELLTNPQKEFRKLAGAAPQDRFSFAGGLLLIDAHLALAQIPEARAAAATLPQAPEKPDWQWERFDALARVELAGTNITAALPHITNAIAAAEAARRPRLQAQSWNLEAELHRKAGQAANAIAAYEKIAAIEALPVDQRRLAVLKTVELLSTSGDTTNAVQRLESYLGSTTNEPAADLLKVKAGELWLEQARTLARPAGRTGPAAGAFTNALANSRRHLHSVVNQFTNSPHLGRAWLNLGWSYWEEGVSQEEPARIQESGAAFRIAAEKLTRSDDQALAIFKMADTQSYLRQTESAITNYLRVLKEYADLPQVRNSLFDKVYAQLVRANIARGDLESAERFVAELRVAFPNNPVTEEILFALGQAFMAKGNTDKATALFQDFLMHYPSSGLAADVRFAEARTHAAKGEYSVAIQKHEQWLNAYTNHQLRADVEFQRGILLEKAGQATNALAVFTNFVARFPKDTLAPAAQTWIADYYYAQDLWPLAEQNYQRVFQNTNWATDPLAYYSRMMAARTAFRREGYNDARSYLTNLVNDPKCPAEVKPEALFALGDIFLEEPIVGSTNALYNFTQAAAVFDRVATQYPTNIIALYATAKKGDCYFQIASHTNYLDSYVIASNAYAVVLNSAAEIPVKVRNQAEFGLARVLERMADGKTGQERALLRKSALNHLLNIVYGGKPQRGRADPYYLKLAGREAGRLAEESGDPDAAIQLYQRLSTEAPAAKSFWQSRIALLQNGREQASAVQ